MQLRLLRSEPLAPILLHSNDYVPSVQNRRGELIALREASDATWEHIRPLIHLVGSGKEDVGVDKADKWLKDVARAVGDHLVYLDVMRLDPASQVGSANGSMPILPCVYEVARSQGVCFVPVVWVGESSKKHVTFVAEAAKEERRGVALRFRFLKGATPAGETREAMLKKLCCDLGCDASSCDLLLDLEYLSPHQDLDPRLVADSINEMAAVASWRSIVLLGSSIPTALGCIDEGTVGSLPRREWELWTQLRSCNLSRMPTYGDYVVQNPRPPADGGWIQMRANIRYTVANETLVARGEGALRDVGKQQYRELCRQIVDLEEFSGANYTEGDRVIEDCARGTTEPGWQTMWRAVGTSHHLRFVTDQLRAEQAVSLGRVAGRAEVRARYGG